MVGSGTVDEAGTGVCSTDSGLNGRHTYRLEHTDVVINRSFVAINIIIMSLEITARPLLNI